MSDMYDLARFVDAQDPVMAQVMSELKAGRKTTHWMWFVFPQIQGLGHSPMARRYAIRSLDEADAYLRHDRLGSRLRACTDLVNGIDGRSIRDILGSPDDVKFRSSMTLFSRATRDNKPYVEAIAKYFDGREDAATVEKLSAISKTI